MTKIWYTYRTGAVSRALTAECGECPLSLKEDKIV